MANKLKKAIIKAMIDSKTSKNDYLIFAVFSAIWIFSGWIAFLSTLGDFFYFWIFWGFLLLMIGVLIRQFILKKISAKISSEFAIVSSSILFFAIISSFFATPTVFSGRDQGAISEAAIRLSQNHRLEFSTPASSRFFEIYGPGKALNFPGFYYNKSGELITQFPIPYISWLTSFYSLFGLSGLIAANAVLLFIFLLSFYLITRFFLEIKYSALLLALTATSFPFFWFFKFTLSENMALALLWLSILWIILFLKEKRLFYYFSFLVSASLMVFTRIEGILFLISGFLTIFFITKKDSFWKEKRKFVFTYPAVFLFSMLILNFAKDTYFYKEMAKAFLVFGNKNGGALEPGNVFSP
ncbi:MAG: glycosyltransferase family 39 protein, partial [bacterium]|nr:glycosyltransferase family 39 protein [bacterium]